MQPLLHDFNDTEYLQPLQQLQQLQTLRHQIAQQVGGIFFLTPTCRQVVSISGTLLKVGTCCLKFNLSKSIQCLMLLFHVPGYETITSFNICSCSMLQLMSLCITCFILHICTCSMFQLMILAHVSVDFHVPYVSSFASFYMYSGSMLHLMFLFHASAYESMHNMFLFHISAYDSNTCFI